MPDKDNNPKKVSPAEDRKIISIRNKILKNLKVETKEKINEILMLGIRFWDQKVEDFYNELLTSEKPETYQILLVLLCSGDWNHICKAAQVLAEKRNPIYLPEIKEILDSLPDKNPPPSLIRCIDILQNIKQNINCNCSLYERLGSGFTALYNPVQEKKQGFLEIIKEKLNKKKYVYEFFCRCPKCGRRWKVTQDIGYHYPTYEWEEITDKKK